ncbi:MAG: PIG-L family deacetylase [Blastochloris sp.]|nr:PIG-L family deacetylase [Blastochloris sp.]
MTHSPTAKLAPLRPGPVALQDSMAPDLFIPDQLPRDPALRRCTHLAIGAHADDLEIMAYHGIAACYQHPELWFGGIVVTDGASSPRSGPYAAYTDEAIQQCRLKEQRQAAQLGQYGFVSQLGLSSEQVRNHKPGQPNPLRELMLAVAPDVLYLHNPADKHETHVAVLKLALDALRSLKPIEQPRYVYGCEVWRDLDWLPDDKKIALDCSPHPELAAALLACFDSQIQGGKRYDLGTLGRRQANATYSHPRRVDTLQSVTWAMDLSPLLNPGLSLHDFMEAQLNRFREEVLQTLAM